MAQCLRKGTYNLYRSSTSAITCHSRITEPFGTFEVSVDGGGGGGGDDGCVHRHFIRFHRSDRVEYGGTAEREML